MGYYNRLHLSVAREHQNYSLIITHALQYLESHYQQELSLSEVAKVVSVNPLLFKFSNQKRDWKKFYRYNY